VGTVQLIRHLLFVTCVVSKFYSTRLYLCGMDVTCCTAVGCDVNVPGQRVHIMPSCFGHFARSQSMIRAVI
jgi:hypothetical protein